MPPGRSCHFLIPGDWRQATGGYRYDRRIVRELRGAGWQVEVTQLGDGFPRPDAAAREDAARRIAALPDGAIVVADGLAFGALPDVAQRHAARLRWVALVHHPLHLETGLDAAARAGLLAQERLALRAARRICVTSAATARDLAALEVPSGRITVVEPGTDRPPATAQRPRFAGAPLRLLCVATLTPRKGHAVLLQALAALAARELRRPPHAPQPSAMALPVPLWELHCVGDARRDPSTAQALRALADRLGIGGRVHWHGELDEGALAVQWAAADLFVLASFHEGYGMAVAEALAHGLPVVCTQTVALAHTLAPAAGVVVPAGDAAALGEALASLLGDAEARAACVAAARRAADELPTWTQAGQRFAAMLEDER